MINYLVVYEYTDITGRGTGNVDAKTKLPLRNIDEVRELERAIAKKHDFTSVVITNLIILGGK